MGPGSTRSYGSPEMERLDRGASTARDEGLSDRARISHAGMRLVLIGASAGGVEALRRVVASLPASLQAAIVVVLHVPPTASSRLPEILAREGRLPVRHAIDGEHLDPGVIYVAPPNRHVIIGDHTLTLADGPRENGVRPAIDPLMRSAARSFGDRAIGVILSGTLDDGTAGMAAVHAHGGVTIAQDPRDAICPGMPKSAIEGATVDYVVPADEIPDLLVDLVREGSPERRAVGGRSVSSKPTDLVCPECGGVLRQFDENGVFRFHCRVGHNYSPESLYAAQDARLEAALWAAIRALEESASMAHRLGVAARSRGARQSADRFDEREREAVERADVVRSAILSLTDLTEIPSIGEAEPVASEDDARRPDVGALVPVAAAGRPGGDGTEGNGSTAHGSLGTALAREVPTERSD